MDAPKCNLLIFLIVRVEDTQNRKLLQLFQN